MTSPAAIRTAFDVTVLWLAFFAGWSLVSIWLTLSCRDVEWLWMALGGGLVGASLAWMTLRRTLAERLLRPAALPWEIRPLLTKHVEKWAISFAVFGLAALVFVPTSNAIPLWAVSILLCLAATREKTSVATARSSTPSRAGEDWLALGLLHLAIIALYLVILRPDGDDAFYVNLPMGLLSAPSCMMAADTMYGAENWPLLGSNYRVEALPTLTAAISWLTGLSVLTVAHLILPLIWCSVWACTLAVIGHALFGRNWILFAVFSVLVSLALAGTLQTWGVHGIARLFHGKAPLILIVIPLIGFVVARSATEPGRLLPIFAALFGLGTIAVGLTANAIYLAPLALLLSIAAAQIAWPGAGMRPLALLFSAITPVATGLWLFFFDRPVSAGDGDVFRFSVDLGLWATAADRLTLAVVLATLAIAALAGRTGAAGRWVAAYLALFLILCVNPVLWPLYDRFVTGGLNFRLWWALPLPTFLAVALTWAVVRTGWPKAGGILVATGLAAMALLPSGLIGMPGTDLRPSIHKTPPDLSTVAAEVTALATPDGTVLAPEAVAMWLPVREGHPDLVYTRTLYLRHNAQIVPPERLAPRRLLTDWINGAADATQTELLAAIQFLDVRLIVLASHHGAQDAQPLLSAADATEIAEVSGYTIWMIPDLENTEE